MGNLRSAESWQSSRSQDKVAQGYVGMLMFSWGVGGATEAGSRQPGSTRQLEQGESRVLKAKEEMTSMSYLPSKSSQGRKSLHWVSTTFFFLLMIFSIYHYFIYMYEVQKQDKLDSVLITDIYINHVGKQGNCKHRLQDGAEARYAGAAGLWNPLG